MARSENRYGYLFVSPLVTGYILFLFLPILAAFTMSLTNWSLIGEFHFVGLQNYHKLFTNDTVFVKTIWNTLYFTVLLVPFNVIITLALALLLQKAIPGIGLFRTVIFTPVVTSFVVWAIVWKYILQTKNGLINSLLEMVGVHGPAWLYTTALAIPIVAMVTLIKGLGINMAIFLAALNDVPKMYYEAASIEGASKFQQFRNVTLPLITPSLFLVITITMIGSMKVFAQIHVMTGGGPGTSTYVFVYYIYEQAFKYFNFGYASAVSFILFFIILALTIVQWLGRRRWVHYED